MSEISALVTKIKGLRVQLDDLVGQLCQKLTQSVIKPVEDELLRLGTTDPKIVQDLYLQKLKENFTIDEIFLMVDECYDSTPRYDAMFLEMSNCSTILLGLTIMIDPLRTRKFIQGKTGASDEKFQDSLNKVASLLNLKPMSIAEYDSGVLPEIKPAAPKNSPPEKMDLGQFTNLFNSNKKRGQA